MTKRWGSIEALGTPELSKPPNPLGRASSTGPPCAPWPDHSCLSLRSRVPVEPTPPLLPALRALACRASLSLDLHAEADQGSFPQFPHPSSGSVLLEGMQGRPGVHWRGSLSSEKGRITSLQGTHCSLGKEDPKVTQQRQLRAARSLEEFPELGGGREGGWSQGAWVRGAVARGVSPAPLHPPQPALQLMAQIQPLQQQRLKNRGWIPPLGRGVHQPGATG